MEGWCCKKHHHVSTSKPLPSQGILRFIQVLFNAILINFLSLSTCRTFLATLIHCSATTLSTWQSANQLRPNRSCTPPSIEHHSSSATCRKHIATAPDLALHNTACPGTQKRYSACQSTSVQTFTIEIRTPSCSYTSKPAAIHPSASDSCLHYFHSAQSVHGTEHSSIRITRYIMDNINTPPQPNANSSNASVNMSSPATSVFSRGHASKSSQSGSSVASSPVPRDSFDLYGTSRLQKVTEEPQEREELAWTTLIDHTTSTGKSDCTYDNDCH